MRALIFFVLILSFISETFAHSGGLNKHGCHNNRKTGEYHCHGQPITEITKSDPSKGFTYNYNRKDWPHWIDADDDCQNERHEILIKYSLEPVKFKRNNGCSVTWGKWLDPYSGQTFVKASDLDIDHIVPLYWAHNHGGHLWSREKRRAFANDHENLLPVDKNLNREKGAAGPDVWLPPNKIYQCNYVKRFDAIVKKYKLRYYDDEVRKIEALLAGCK